MTLLCLAAFPVRGDILTNWARTGTALQSTTYNANSVASRAIDGDTSGTWSGNYMSHTLESDTAAWWQVDLGGQKPVGHIHVWFREDCCQNRNESLRIAVYDSTNLTTRVLIWETNNVYMYSTVPRDLGYNLPVTVNAGAVFIEHVAGAPSPIVCLAEVEVFNQPLVELNNYARDLNGGTAINSSCYVSDCILYGAQQAIDGNHHGISSVNNSPYLLGYSAPDNTTTNLDGTLMDPLPWWRGDFGAPQTIGSVVLWPRRDRTLTRFLNIQLTVADVNTNTLYQQKFTVQPSGPKYVVNFVPAIANAKIVMVNTTPDTPDKFLNLPEVEAFAPLPSAPTITFITNLANVTVQQNRPATFGPVAVTVDGGIRPEEISYRWYLNGAEIPNAAGSWLNSYSTVQFAQPANTGDKVKVQASVSGYGVFSAEATLTVTNDITPPTMITNQVQVTDQVRIVMVFDELLDPATATNASNYVLSGGPTVGDLTLGADGKTVTLVVQNVLLGDSVALTVSGVKDLAGNAMATKNINASIPQTPINYALGGTATQNSNYTANQPASRAIDGNTAGSWGAGSLSCTANGALGWWEVDLKSTKTMGTIKVWWRTDCCQVRNENVDLVIYDTADLATRVELLRVPLTGATLPPNPTVLDLGSGQAGRVVRLEHTAATDQSVPENVQLCLAEVQLFPPPNGLVVTPDPSSWTVYAGDRIFLRSGSVGQTPITTQWLHNGVPVPGATAPELVITNITVDQAGSYVFAATNAVRTRFSQASTVVVNPRPPMANNLAARYLFTADGGTNVLDDAPFGPAKTASHDGVNAGAVWVASVTDTKNVTRTGVMQFDPTLGNQQIAIQPQADLNSPVGTIAFWLNAPPPSAGKAGLFDRRGGTNNWGDVLILNANSTDSPNGLPDVIFDQAYPSGLNVGGVTPVDDSNWHHIAYVYTWLPFGIISFYIDGKLDAELTHGDQGAWPLDRQLEFGQSHDGYWPPLTGYMDDIHIFNRTLNAAEITELMTTGVPALPPTLSVSVEAGQLKLTWTQTGYILQENANVANAAGWSDIPGATTGSYSIPLPTTGNKFYRLKK